MSRKKLEGSWIRNVSKIFSLYHTYDHKLLIFSTLKIPSKLSISLISLILPKIVLDGLAQKSDIESFVFNLLILTIALLLSNLIYEKTDNWVYMKTREMQTFYFRQEVNRKAMDMDYELFTSPTGKVLYDKARHCVEGDFGSSIIGFVQGFFDAIISLAGLGSFCIVLSTLNPIIIPLLILSYGIDGFIMLISEKKVNESKKERSVILRKLRYVVSSTRNTDVAKDVRLYDMRRWLNQLAETYAARYLKDEKQVATTRIKALIYEAVLILFRDGGAYAYLIYKAIHSDMSVGDFVLYFSTIAGFSQWLTRLVMSANDIVNANYNVSDYFNFIESPDKRNRSSGVCLPEKNTPVEIRLENVSYCYPGSDKMVLAHVSLHIKKGEKIAVVGLNGAGKTTLIKIICGLLTPTQGSVYVNGIDMMQYNREEYYTMFAAVFQDSCLFPASIANNITCSTKDQVNQMRLDECIRSAGLAEKISSLAEGAETPLVKTVLPNAIELSGGELQKLWLARALYRDSNIIVLDEPTAALDPLAESHIYEKYNEITAHKTSIYISHRLASTKFCDRIVLLDHAKIEEEGSHEELMAKGLKYAELFSLQSQYYQKNSGEML